VDEWFVPPYKIPEDARPSVEIIVDFFRDRREKFQDYPLAKR
jgi:hypothetical protein